MNSAMINQTTYPVSTVSFPVVAFTSAVKVKNSINELKYVKSSAIANGIPYIPQIFWAPDDCWYQAVNIKKIRKAPFLMRFFGPDDLIEASFDLIRVADYPIDVKYYYDLVYGTVGLQHTLTKEQEKQGKRALKAAIQSQKTFVDWMNTYS